MKKIKIIGLFLSLFSILMAQEVQVPTDTLYLNLEICRQMSLENSEIIKIADATLEKAENQKKAAHSAYFPNISASATAMYADLEYKDEIILPMPPAGINIPIEIATKGGITAGVTAQQPIYAGGKISAVNNMAKIGISMANENKELKCAENKYEADQAYFTYISVKEKVKLAKKYRTLVDSLYTMVANSCELGMASPNDLLKVKVQLNEVILQQQKAENGLELARMSLCRVVGMPYSTLIMLNDSLKISPTAVTIDSVDVSNRVEYKLLSNQVTMTEQNIRMIRSDYMPTAGVAVGYNYLNLNLQDRDNFNSHGVNVMAQVKIPITTFGERKGKIRAEKSELTIKQYELQHAQGLLTLEIEQAKLNLIDAELCVKLSEEALQQASENLRITQDSYEVGMETIVNLLQAQVSWQEAYNKNIDANIDKHLKTSYFLKVSNKL